MCDSDSLSVKADKHGPQYFLCNDCGYSESAEHSHDDLDDDETLPVTVKKTSTKKVVKKSNTKKRGKK